MKLGSVPSPAAVVTVILLALPLTGCHATFDASERAADVTTPAPAESRPDTLPYLHVRFEDYLDAAARRGVRADYLITEDEFVGSLANLCDNTPSDFAALDAAHRSAAGASDSPPLAYRWMTEETAIRLALACPDHIPAWSTVSG